jgi:hypothetical protein
MTTEKNKAPTETTDKKPKESFKLIIWLSFGFIVTFVFGYLGFLVYVSWPISEWSVSKAASLGDSFGILSSLFSGLAFAGLIVTIVMQNKTLKAQMEELELARKEYKRQGDELAGQKEVMDSQFQAIQIQQFESTFFKLYAYYKTLKTEEVLSDSNDSSETKSLTLLFDEFYDYENIYSPQNFQKYYSKNNEYIKSLSSIARLICMNSSVLGDKASFYSDFFRGFVKESEYSYLIVFLFSNESDYTDEIKFIVSSGLLRPENVMALEGHFCLDQYWLEARFRLFPELVKICCSYVSAFNGSMVFFDNLLDIFKNSVKLMLDFLNESIYRDVKEVEELNRLKKIALEFSEINFNDVFEGDESFSFDDKIIASIENIKRGGAKSFIGFDFYEETYKENKLNFIDYLSKCEIKIDDFQNSIKSYRASLVQIENVKKKIEEILEPLTPPASKNLGSDEK